LTDWIDQHAEIGCFRIARICIDLSAFAWILSQTSAAASAVGIGSLGLQTAQFALILVGLGAIMILRTTFERAGGTGRERQGGQANPLRAAMYTHRLTCLFWLAALVIKAATAPAGFGSFALIAVGGFATAALYVGACSQPPPKQREHKVSDDRLRLAPTRSG
jgi:hypothetical protein